MWIMDPGKSTFKTLVFGLLEIWQEIAKEKGLCTQII